MLPQTLIYSCAADLHAGRRHRGPARTGGVPGGGRHGGQRLRVQLMAPSETPVSLQAAAAERRDPRVGGVLLPHQRDIESSQQRR